MILHICSPLEQFLILPIIKLPIVNLIITNQLIFLILSFSFFYFLNKLFNKISSNKTKDIFLVPTNIQIIIEIIIKTVFSVISDNIKSRNSEQFFPIILVIFLLLINLNLIGLIPFSFTATSHLIVTFTLSCILFFGINIICFKKHGLKFFSLFLPSGTNIELAFLLVPIELISYFFKLISLSMRLFANMMAGHTLLKVIAGFGLTLLQNKSPILFLFHFFPLLILIPLFVLETAVAIIQAFVFTVLFCIHLNDAINLH